MSNKLKQEMDKIEIPNNLHQRSKLGVQKAKLEMSKNRRFLSKGIAIAVSLLITFGSYSLFKKFFDQEHHQSAPDNHSSIITADGGLIIPAIQLPKNTRNEAMSMIGLIVYNGKIYTQTATEVDMESAKQLLGEKLGTTKGNINEWSKQDAYAVEFASTTGVTDVFAVQGYDKDFRIMTYDEYEGEVFTEFYECLNGITVHNGKDIFGKLKMGGNIVSAQHRKHSDWDYSVDNYHSVENMELFNSFVEELDHTVPYPYDTVEATLGDFRNDENYKEVIIHLRDGSRISLVVIKGGYIRYGFANVYFKMDHEIFTELWAELTNA